MRFESKTTQAGKEVNQVELSELEENTHVETFIQGLRALAALKKATRAKEFEKEIQQLAREWGEAHPDSLSWDEPFAEAIAFLMDMLAQ